MAQNFTRQIKRIDRKLNLTKNNLNLTNENSFYLIPFKITLGFINQSNLGVNENLNIYDFATWQRIFTGLANLIARWKDSTIVYKKNDDDLFLTKEYVVGAFIRAFITTKSSGVSFEPSPIDNNFVSQLTNESVEVYTYEPINDEELQDFYIIPQIGSNKWLYIENVIQHEYAGKKLYKLTLSSVNNKIAQSGRAIEEYIQFGAPGEGYAFPQIDEKGNVALDTTKTKDIYIQSYQVEISGPAAFATAYCWGRPIEVKDDEGIIEPQFNPKIEAPRLLLPFSIETPISSPINTKPNAENNYFYGIFQPKYADVYEKWTKQWENNFNPTDRNEYEGMIYAPNRKIIEDSNPLNADDGAHQYVMWDQNWKVNIPKTNFNTSADNMTAENLTLDGFYTIPQLLMFNIFITSQIDAIPLSVEQLVSWNLKDLHIILGFLNKLTFGIPIGWRQLNVRIPAPSIPLFIPSSIVKFGNSMREQSMGDNELMIPLEIFSGGINSDATTFSGINSMGSIIKIQLTDRFSKVIDGITYTFNTVDLGQDMPLKDDEGKKIEFKTKKPEKLHIDKTCEPIARKKYGYVIDYSGWKGLSKNNYRATFFTAGTLQVHSGTYKSNALFTGAIRDWTNIMKQSDWKTQDNKIINYPKDIVEPQPPGQLIDDITLTNYLSQNKVHNSLIIGTPIGRMHVFTRLLEQNYQADGFRQSSTKLTPWKKVGYRAGEYDLTQIGGIAGLLQNYENMIITFKITTDNVDETSREFPLQIPITEIVKQNKIDFDLKSKEWIDKREMVPYNIFHIRDNSVINGILQCNDKCRVSARGQNSLIKYNEYHRTVFTTMLDGNKLKFGWNENITGFIPNQILQDNGNIVSDNKPAYPNFGKMMVEGGFQLNYAMNEFGYITNPSAPQLIEWMEITQIYLQSKNSL